MQLSAKLLLVALGVLLALVLWGAFGWHSRKTVVHADVLAGPAGPAGPATGTAPTLFVLVHGYNPSQKLWAQMAQTLQPHGAVLRLRYNAGPFSNADPDEITRRMSDEIAKATTATGATRVVLVAHSMGALLTRRTLLLAHSQAQPWFKQVQRVVLLAGVNRGWDVSGEPPADASTLNRWLYRGVYWWARLLGTSSLIFEFERGSRFVANLRLDWMRWMHDTPRDEQLEVVQLLGDIDEIVSREDNEDLRVISSARFALLRVRGTGHADIIDLGLAKRANAEKRELGEYRKQKLMLAATGDFNEVRLHNEAQLPKPNEAITELVFVLHGIRDLGRWSARFETEIRRQFPARREQLAIVSSRYGYLGMGPFLFPGVREKYVRWFMDEYTEALARYPHVKPENIRFFGHSNGSYILAKALERYASMKIDRVVFAGSVVPRNYAWAERSAQVNRVRNYVGTQDWVVALFPRLFELPLVRLLHNDLGSAGFNGFDACMVDNVRFVKGEHSAFEDRVGEIVDFLLRPDAPPPARKEDRDTWLGEALSWSPTVLTVWAFLLALVVYLGARVVSASPSPTWPVLLLYALLVLGVLRTV